MLRWDAPTADTLRQILEFVRGTAPRTRVFRDVYFDTPDGDLRRRAVRCRARYDAAGPRTLAVWLPGDAKPTLAPLAAEIPAGLAIESAALARLRAVTDPARLVPWIEREVQRARYTLRLPLLSLPLCDVVTDAMVVRRGELSAPVHEAFLEPRRWGSRAARRLAASLEAAFPLRPAGDDPVQRALGALDAAEGERLARELRGERDVALIAVQHGRLGLARADGELRLPVERGAGEAACRVVLRRIAGSGEGQLRFLGVAPPAGERRPLEVWVVRQLHRVSDDGGTAASLQWFTPAELIERVGSPVLRDARTIAALTVAARSPLVPEWSGAAFGDAAEHDAAPDVVARQSRVTLSEMRGGTAALTERKTGPPQPAPEHFLNAELSWVEFNARVLALAEDPATPAAARVRFLSIFSTNLDHFVATQLAALKQLVALGRTDPAADSGGLSPQETLDAVALRLRPLIARQYRAFQGLLRRPEGGPVAVVRWNAVGDPAQSAALRARFTNEVLPFLSPKSLTRSPGHPFPVVGDRRLALLVALRDRTDSPVHYGLVEIPDALPRFVPLATGQYLPMEDLVRAQLDLLYPGGSRVVVSAHAFRLTRSGDLQLDEAATANFLQAIEEEIARRQQRPVVRIEIEASCPAPLRDLLQRELHFAESEHESTLSPADIYVAPDGEPIDLGGLRELPAASWLPDYAPFSPQHPFAPDRPLCDQLEAGDVLVHHPHDAFGSSVERFIVEAADDPDVQAIKLTLYRPGGAGEGPSAIGDALRRAAASGKDVAVLVELKARFDEARNIAWARGLERDGIHVVTGLVSLKTHAKLALVVRRGPGGRGARRYAHIGSGNYNPETALLYTDVGLFTADPRITADVHALFNDLTGTAHGPRAPLPHLLVAPTNMLERFLGLIERETAHARAGRAARIRAKLNGLADATVIEALYGASQAGVDVQLVVRGICTLRPGIPGLSERIQVVSILGRFLEHARVFHFAAGGADEYYIGSADWRPRNLRRRVEVVTPVYGAGPRAQLDRLLTRELASEAAWVLQPDGSYERRVALHAERSAAMSANSVQA